MTRHPLQPLDAQERAMAAMLQRPHGRSEPGAELDAYILAAAQSALHPAPARRPPQQSWIAPMAVAASLVLAVGLAWQLRPPPAPAAQQQAADAASAGSDAMGVFAIEAPPASPEAQTPSTATRMVQAPPLPANAPPADAVAKRMAAPVAAVDTVEMAAAPVAVPPPQPPAPSAVVISGNAGTVQQMAEPARAPAMAKARTSEAVRERSQAAGNTPAQAEAAAQRAAADATTLDTVTILDDPGEEVPPATVDSPEVREAWLRRIGELLEQGKPGEAKASLDEFRRRYPDATLPPELRKLEP